MKRSIISLSVGFLLILPSSALANYRYSQTEARILIKQDLSQVYPLGKVDCYRPSGKKRFKNRRYHEWRCSWSVSTSPMGPYNCIGVWRFKGSRKRNQYYYKEVYRKGPGCVHKINAEFF